MARKTASSSSVIEIRKYSNRRLYDTHASGYITLANVAQMIRDGKEIRVVDAKTGEDLTRTVMLQIICESKAEQEALPIDFLRQIIQASSQSVRSSIKDFLIAGLGAHKEMQSQVTQLVRVGMMVNPITAPFVTAWEHLAKGAKAAAQQRSTATSSSEATPQKHSTTALQSAELPPSTVQSQTDSSGTPDPESNDAVREREIQRIQQQLAMLQKQIDEL